MLEINNISKKIHGYQVLKQISFSLAPGEIFGLLGPNGAGKTTLFSIIIGMLKASEGDLLLDGYSITRLSSAARIKRGMSYLPQESSLFPELTVQENILAALELKMRLKKKDILYKIDSILQTLKIDNIKNKEARLLSGGQRRRTEFARLLACEPKYVLLDEPFAGVDPLSIDEIQKQITLLKNHGIGVLISDHNVTETLKICQRASVLFDGEILMTGPSSEILADQRVKKYYLGYDC